MRQEVRATMAPDSAPPRLPANIYETAGGEAYVLEVAAPGLESSEIVIEADAGSVVVRTETLENGILRIRVPKAAAGRRKVIRVTPGRPASQEGGNR